MEGKNTLHVSWRVPSIHEPAHGFIVRLLDAAGALVQETNISSMSVHSARIPSLEFNREYGLQVFVYHCTGLGPPSDLRSVTINSKGGSLLPLPASPSTGQGIHGASWQGRTG